MMSAAGKVNFDTHYRGLVNSGSVEPPGHVWEALAADLAVDAVWSNISEDLDLAGVTRLENISFATSVGIALVALLLLIRPISGPPLERPLQQSQATETEVPQTFHIETNPVISDSELLPEERDMSTASGVVVARQSNQGITALSGPVQHAASESGWESQMNMPIDFQKEGILLSGSDLQLIEMRPIQTSFEFIAQPAPSRGFAGIVGSLQNTWLLNDKTLTGFSPQELHTTKAVFTRQFGITAGSRLKRHFTIAGELFFSSNYSQNYEEYQNGQYVTNVVDVDYTKLNLILEADLSRNEYANGHTALILGPSVGLLTRATETLDGVNVDATQSYNRYMVGVVAGVQRNFNIIPQIQAYGGFRLSYGLTNIYGGTTSVPAAFRSTHPAAINLTLGLRYSPLRK